MGIAVWSNLSAFYLLALMALLVLYETYSNREKIDFKRHLLYVAVACIVIAAINLLPLLKTVTSGDAFGGRAGLFQDSIVNYANQFIHFNSEINRLAVVGNGWKMTEVVGMILFCMWIILHLFSYFFKTDVRLSKMQHYTLFLVIGVAIIAKILFVFFDVPYPTARTQLLYSIPFYLGICVAFERIIAVKRSFIVIPWLIIVFLGWHFIYSVTFENTFEWWQNGDAKRVVRYLKEEIGESKPDRVLKLGIEAWQFPSMAFYTENEFKDVMTTHWTDLSTDGEYDYLFVPFHLAGKVWEGYEPDRRFKHGQLYKKR